MTDSGSVGASISRKDQEVGSHFLVYRTRPGGAGFVPFPFFASEALGQFKVILSDQRLQEAVRRVAKVSVVKQFLRALVVVTVDFNL